MSSSNRDIKNSSLETITDKELEARKRCSLYFKINRLNVSSYQIPSNEDLIELNQEIRVEELTRKSEVENTTRIYFVGREWHNEEKTNALWAFYMCLNYIGSYDPLSTTNN